MNQNIKLIYKYITVGHEAAEKLKNVYVVGELLDIDGECGGYNLQWAWTSGYVAGSDIIKKISKEAQHE